MLLHQYVYGAALKLALFLFQTTTQLNDSVADSGESGSHSPRANEHLLHEHHAGAVADF